MMETEPGRDRPARLRIVFGPTTSPALPAAIRAAQALPGYQREGAPPRGRHVVDTPLPFGDAATWQRLRAVIDTVGRWTASVVEIGGRRCGPLWRGVHDLEAVLTCYHRRPAGARGADYCAGKPTPTADATTWGCRFVRGVDLATWGDSRAPWYHFGQLTDEGTRFVVDKPAITQTLHHASRDQACRWCPAFGWPTVDAMVAALPDAVAVSPDRGYALRYSERDPTRPVGITRTDPDRDRAVAVRGPLEEEDEGAAVPRPVPTVRYADVAGQAPAVQTVRDVCELPLTHGAYFAALGLAPPRGVILYGPPGNGKTLLAQAVATETAAHLEIISGPEILSQWVGGSEAHLRQVFARARVHQPAVILIDELDALAGRRDGRHPPHQTQLVAQLLVLLDGLDARGQVVVLATTNRLAAIDPAIRRPGRFDAHIAVPVPDCGGRLAILQRHAPPGLAEAPRRLAQLAARTAGWSGAELAALCRAAGVEAIKRAVAAAQPAEAVRVQRSDVQIALAAWRQTRAPR